MLQHCDYFLQGETVTMTAERSQANKEIAEIAEIWVRYLSILHLPFDCPFYFLYLYTIFFTKKDTYSRLLPFVLPRDSLAICNKLLYVCTSTYY